MRLYLADKMVRLNVTVTYFFRLAHVWRFGRDTDVQWDVLQYMTAGDIPPYVEAYICDMQTKERNHVSLQTMP